MRRARRRRDRITNREIRRFSRSFDREVGAWLSPVALPMGHHSHHAWLFALMFVVALGAIFAATTLAALWFSPVVAGAVPTLTIASAAIGAAIARLRRGDDAYARDVRRPTGYAKATDETTDL